MNEFKVCVVCLKYELDCRCVFSVIKNQFRGKNCKHCHQRHHYLLCQTPVGLLHSEKIRKRFLGLTKKRGKGKRQKNNFPEQFVNGKFVFTITKPKLALYMEELYGYGTALGVKQPKCPLGVYAHGRVCEVNPESNQGQPTSPRDPPTTPKWTEPRLWQGCACQDIECDSLYPACPFGEFDVDVDLNQHTPARDPPTTPERKTESNQCPPTSPCGPEFRVASCPIKTEAETLNIKDCDPFMRPHPFAATSIEECLSEPSNII